MAKKLQKLTAAFLAVVMCMTLVCTTAFAKPNATKRGNTEAPAQAVTMTVAGTEASVFPAEVKGAEAAAQVVVGDVAAIYIEAEGKVPAVVWTSEDVDSALLAQIIEELCADPEAVAVSGYGDQKITYQHNKNKTKTVTYTFE